MALETMYEGKSFSPSTILTQGINDTATRIYVEDIDAFPDAPNLAVLGETGTGEVIKYFAKGVDFLDGVQRGVDGVQQVWNAGDKIARNFTKADYDAMRQNIIKLSNEKLDSDGIADDSEKLDGNPSTWYQQATDGLSAEAAIVDEDTFPFYEDSTSSHRKATWANIKAVLKTYFDGLYAAFTVATANIANNAVTNAKQAQMAAYTLKGNNTNASADPQDITASNVRSMIDAAADSHAHGFITTDGKIGSVANLPIFTGTAGALDVKSAADAKIALNIAPHNYLYAGRDLSTIFTAAQLHAAVSAGDFSNIRVGDYWPITLTGTYYDYAESANKTLSSAVVNLEVAGIDTYLQYGDTAAPHHLVMISRDCLPNTMKMRSEEATWYNTSATNPWLGSAAYETFNNTTNGILALVAATALGAYIYAGANDKGMRFFGETKAAEATVATSWSWLDRGKLWLPTEREVWGQDVWSEHDRGGGVPIQTPIFAGSLRHIIKGLGNGGSRCTWWCSSSFSGTAVHFCAVANYGFASGYVASDAYNAYGVPLCFLFS